MLAGSSRSGGMNVVDVPSIDARNRDLRFFRTLITVMAIVLVSGFTLNVALGRSSFASPLIVHAHALVYMGWVALVVTQVWLSAAGAKGLHRALGGLMIVWALAMLIAGVQVTIAAARDLRVPFFFQPQHFILLDTAAVFGSMGLFAAAVALRGRPDWHPRLQTGAFVLLMGPGIGRLLPMPLLTPYAMDIAFGIPLVLPLIGMARDRLVHGRVHPAWGWPLGLLVIILVGVRLAAFSPAGDALYSTLVAGSRAEGTDGRAFPPPPPAALPAGHP